MIYQYYGNGIREVDQYAAEIIRDVSNRVNLRPNSRNGFFMASGHGARTFITFGKFTGATPDGRMAGDEISKNLSPTMGADTNGITALIQSITAIDAMLHPSAAQGDD